MLGLLPADRYLLLGKFGVKAGDLSIENRISAICIFKNFSRSGEFGAEAGDLLALFPHPLGGSQHSFPEATGISWLCFHWLAHAPLPCLGVTQLHMPSAPLIGLSGSMA